jgi:hypothetical protein
MTQAMLRVLRWHTYAQRAYSGGYVGSISRSSGYGVLSCSKCYGGYRGHFWVKIIYETLFISSG